MSEEKTSKKRVRRKKSELINESNSTSGNEQNNENIVLQIEETKPIEPKKRGRKPKGGKLLPKNKTEISETEPVQNVILHLKCFTKDLFEKNNMTDPFAYNHEIPPDIMSYSIDNQDQSFALYDAKNTKQKPAYSLSNKEDFVCSKCKNENVDCSNNKSDTKEIKQKLKKIKLDLYKNNLSDKQSACFWCTFEFDNPPCYIPRYEMDGEMYAYGSFCRPECAVAYLMKENLDDSTKFERYQFINQIYGKIYNFKKNIKPAPNPYFLLDKFYGNLSIQEYRKLLNSEHMLSVIDKPLTRILPELHEDNDNFNSSGIGQTNNSSSHLTGGYKVKRKSEKQNAPSKNEILRENFGLAS